MSDDNKKRHRVSLFKIVATIGGFIASIIAIVSFFFMHFVTKDVHNVTMSELENKTATVLEKIVQNQTEFKLQLERIRSETTLEALKVRRDFLRSRNNLTPSQERELEVLDSKIQELLAILN